VVDAADEAGRVSRTVLDGVMDIGREANTMRAKIEQFLIAVGDDTGGRRQHEQVSGATATVRMPGRAAATETLRDITRVGASVAGE
jgi:hypothetical protein